MKKVSFLLLSILSFLNASYAQKQETIVVRAGTALLDYFPMEERYLFPDFTTGRIIFKANNYSEQKMNYNYLNGEIEYLQGSDTLLIVNKDDIKYICLEKDTLYHEGNYILQIRNDYPKIGLKELVELKEIQKKDPYGIASSGSSTISYNALPSDGNYYKLKANQDMVYKRTRTYYIMTPENNFVFYNKKNVLDMYPVHKDQIKAFIKTNKIKFDAGEDILRLTDFLGSL